MSMNNKNTVAARDVVFTPELTVTVAFFGGATYHGALGDLTPWVRERSLNAPLWCKVDGVRHGLYACILATDDRLASGLSVLTSQRVLSGDGATFATRSQCRDVANRLKRVGIAVTQDSIKWGITNLPFATDYSQPAPQPKASAQPTEEEQMNDAPWA